ncbi:unnamed protein product, partial [Coregonus sp. 'balchen']
YVYFENSSSNPYLIRRIEELNKTANGNVEAKVVCLFRRRDISGNLNTLADSNAKTHRLKLAATSRESLGERRRLGLGCKQTAITGPVYRPSAQSSPCHPRDLARLPGPLWHAAQNKRPLMCPTGLRHTTGDFEEESKQPTVSEQQKHQLKHRELFLSRQFESLPATHIRGKCNVTLLNETDVLAGYLEKEECFFYSLVFDPVQKTLLADQGEIRVGSKYQAEIPDKLAEVLSDYTLLGLSSTPLLKVLV